MKKKTLPIAFLTLLTLFSACEKEKVDTTIKDPARNRVVVIPSDSKTGNTTLLMMRIGHNAKDCTGCVVVDGHLTHVNCQGAGNYCPVSAAVNLQQTGMTFTATTTDTFDLTSEDFFLMPDRSLNYRDEKGNIIFLNIPAQLVYRDSTTRQFTFTGLSFSEKAAYNNN